VKILSAIFDDIAVIIMLATIAAIFAMLAITWVPGLYIIAVLVFAAIGVSYRVCRVYKKSIAREQLAKLFLSGIAIQGEQTQEFTAWHKDAVKVLTKYLGTEYVARFQAHSSAKVWAIEEFMKELS
jgi:hypothetical protein